MQRDARRAWAQTLVGRQLGERYTLDSLIDVGGMGAVFVASDAESGTNVAVKTLVPGALDDTQMERLRREARQAAAVGGAGVVDVTDAGEDPVCGPFLVMEWLKGETLAARLEREGALSIGESTRVATAVLETLGEVHRQGLVHRDLKPENLFLTRTDEVKILDFGVARPAHATGDTLTSQGGVVGTPRFMAPEQARADTRVDARADVYAVGATLYTMLSGRRPYAELDAADALVATTAGPPRSLTALSASIPISLVRVVERAMATEREERFESAEAMQTAIRRALDAPAPRADDADTVTSTGAGTSTGAVTPLRGSRRRLGLALVAGLAAAFATGLAWAGWTAAPDAASPAESVAETDPVDAPINEVTTAPLELGEQADRVDSPAAEPVAPTAPPPEPRIPAVEASAPVSRPARRARPEPRAPGRTGVLRPEDF